MTRALVKLVVSWAFLMAVAGGEFLVSGMQMPMAARPVLLFFAATMVATVGIMFMHLGKAPLLAKGFAVAAIFWLVVLFGMGSMDALTRTWYPVQHYNPY